MEDRKGWFRPFVCCKCERTKLPSDFVCDMYKRKPLIGSCGHTVCEQCWNVKMRCPTCSAEDAFNNPLSLFEAFGFGSYSDWIISLCISWVKRNFRAYFSSYCQHCLFPIVEDHENQAATEEEKFCQKNPVNHEHRRVLCDWNVYEKCHESSRIDIAIYILTKFVGSAIGVEDCVLKQERARRFAKFAIVGISTEGTVSSTKNERLATIKEQLYDYCKSIDVFGPQGIRTCSCTKKWRENEKNAKFQQDFLNLTKVFLCADLNICPWKLRCRQTENPSLIANLQRLSSLTCWNNNMGGICGFFDLYSKKPCFGTCSHYVCSQCANATNPLVDCPVCKRSGMFENRVVDYTSLRILEKFFKNCVTLFQQVLQSPLMVEISRCPFCDKKTNRLWICVSCCRSDKAFNRLSGIECHEKTIIDMMHCEDCTVMFHSKHFTFRVDQTDLSGTCFECKESQKLFVSRNSISSLNLSSENGIVSLLSSLRCSNCLLDSGNTKKDFVRVNEIPGANDLIWKTTTTLAHMFLENALKGENEGLRCKLRHLSILNTHQRLRELQGWFKLKLCLIDLSGDLPIARRIMTSTTRELIRSLRMQWKVYKSSNRSECHCNTLWENASEEEREVLLELVNSDYFEADTDQAQCPVDIKAARRILEVAKLKRSNVSETFETFSDCSC